MDVNTLLKNLRDQLVNLRDLIDNGYSLDEEIDDVSGFLDTVDALDEWMSKGGMTPDAWAVRGR